MTLFNGRILAATTCLFLASGSPLHATAVIADNAGTSAQRQTAAAQLQAGSPSDSPKVQPAERQGISISEPSNIVMLALGVAGLVAGRYAAKRHRNGS